MALTREAKVKAAIRIKSQATIQKLRRKEQMASFFLDSDSGAGHYVKPPGGGRTDGDLRDTKENCSTDYVKRREFHSAGGPRWGTLSAGSLDLSLAQNFAEGSTGILVLGDGG